MTGTVARLSFPRAAGAAAAAVVGAGAVATPVVGIAVGAWGAASVALGTLLGAGTLGLSVAVVYAADRLDNRLALPTAFAAFLFCLLFVALIGQGVGEHGLVRRVPVGLTVLCAALLWVVVHVVVTLRSTGPAGPVAPG